MKYIWLFFKTLLRFILKPLSFLPAIIMMYVIFNFSAQDGARKLAHFTEYFLLAVSVAFPLYVYGMRGIWLVLFAGAFCVGFAFLDEYHQTFVSGRSPSKRDVFIDGCGSVLGIFVTRIVGFIGRKTIFAPLAKSR